MMGLHADDIRRLLQVLNQLVDAGNTVIVIEHNLDVIKCADHLIDLGRGAGDEGGGIVGCGTPEVIAGLPDSYTGQYLKQCVAKASGSGKRWRIHPARRSTQRISNVPIR